MATRFIIRPANIDDSPALGRIQLDSWRKTQGAEMKPSSYWAQFSYDQRERAWRNLLNSDRPVTALAALTTDDQLIGFAWTERNRHAFSQYEIELSAIHILPSYRGQGLGTLLIASTAQALIKAGYRSLMLWTHKRNKSARQFYDKLGGQLLGQEPIDIDGVPFTNLAYGWSDILRLTGPIQNPNSKSHIWRFTVNQSPVEDSFELEASEIDEEFDRLQRKLSPLWESIGRSDPGGPAQQPNTVVVVPSLTADIELTSAEQQAYEERFLFMLFLLHQPNIRMIYITSTAIQPSIIDYYLDILPGVIISNARKRLELVSPLDGSTVPLTRKILDRPPFIQYICSLIADPDRAHLVPFTTTELERELAVSLGIPMYAADPRFFAFGTKSGSRRIFAEEGVSHPLGYENLHSAGEIVESIVKMRAQRAGIEKVIVKLNEGVSGIGNAVLDLGGLPPSGDTNEYDLLHERLREMQFELASVEFDSYMVKMIEHGAIVEELIIGDLLHSPSAQLRISPLGEVELLSTHDQMLGGPSGQSYLGAIFPADADYAPMIMDEASKIGHRFAKEGIVGRFAIDFVVVRTPTGKWTPFAIEVNLRKGGTTHPYLTLQYLTDGSYDAGIGLFWTARGHNKYYIASDHVESKLYRLFTPDDLFDIVSTHRFHFDHTSQTGIVLHMVSGVGSSGRLGVTAIENTPESAAQLYRDFVAALDDEAITSTLNG